MTISKNLTAFGALAAAALMFTACTSAPEETPEPAPVVTVTVTETAAPDTDEPSGPTDIVTATSALGECSQASALAGTMYRAEWQRNEGIIDNDKYYAIADAIGDSWTKALVAQSDVSEKMLAVKEAAQNGILGNYDFDNAYGELETACTGAGYTIAMTALEGQSTESE